MADIDQLSTPFDEDWYLLTYPDVATTVARGDWKSGFDHYEKVGRERGRFASAADKARRLEAANEKPASSAGDNPPKPALAAPDEFDPRFYAEAYPLAREEVADRVAVDFTDHYARFGRHRGYLPNKTAPRMENPAKWMSRFGGFWTDQANAMDLVAGKLDLGFINGRQANLLRRFIQDGYVVIERAVPDDVLAAAEAAVDRAYNGGFPDAKYHVDGVGNNLAWTPESQVRPAKALDLHWLSAAIRDLIFTPLLMDLIHLVFERRAFATQTLSFWRGSAQGAHQDSAYVNYSLPMQFLASWIALEDVSPDSGELFYYVGSQRMPEFLYIDRFKGVEEAGRLNPGFDLQPQIRHHVQRIPIVAAEMKLPARRFLAKRGDILIWSADLAHGGSPISTANTRKSVVTHYTTAEAVPSYFELHPGKIRASYRGESYSSVHYDFQPREAHWI